MESKTTADKHRSNEEAELRLEDVDSFIEYMEGLLEESQGKINQLPRVDESGYSECPFAEDLYAYKEEAAGIVAVESKKLEPFLELVNEEIERCRHNIEQLRVDGDSLNLDEAKQRYEAAKRSLESRYGKAVFQKKRLIDLIKRSEELLELAQEKKWPIGEPSRKDRFNPEEVIEAAIEGRFSALWEPEPVMSRAARPSFSSGINNLLSLGPLGGKGI